MRWNEIGTQDCSVARCLSVVGDRWTLLILREVFLGTRRYDDFQDRTGAPRAVLTERLKALVGDGVLDRRRYAERPDRFEYRLTAKGRDLYPVIVSLLRWGDTWMAGAAGPPLVLRHKRCGADMLPTLTCPECGDPLGPHDVEARPRGADPSAG